VTGWSNFTLTRVSMTVYLACETARTAMTPEYWDSVGDWVLFAAWSGVCVLYWRHLSDVERQANRHGMIPVNIVHAARRAAPVFLVIDLFFYAWTTVMAARHETVMTGTATVVGVVADVAYYCTLYWALDITPPSASTIRERVKAWIAAHRPQLPSWQPTPVPGFGRT